MDRCEYIARKGTCGCEGDVIRISMEGDVNRNMLMAVLKIGSREKCLLNNSRIGGNASGLIRNVPWLL